MKSHILVKLQTLLAAVLVLLMAAPAFAKPPPWAPAHGYRNQHKDHHDYPPILPWHGRGYKNDYVLGGRCDRAGLGAVLGGMVGGIAGSQIGKGSGQTAATIAGTVIGILVGRSIGRHMDANDQQCTGQTLEHAPDRATVRWHDPDSGTSYGVTPLKTWRHQDGRYCREYTTHATVGGRSQQLYGQACRQPDGSWVRR
jgi:surface antigen